MNLDDVFHSTKWEKEFKRTVKHIECVLEHWDEVSEIKELIANEDYEGARWLYSCLSDITKIGLWRAPTKGGIFTLEERKVLKPNESTE